MLDRVNLGLDQQVDDEAGGISDEEPEDADDGLDDGGRSLLSRAEPQDLVNGIEQAVERFEQSLEDLDDAADDGEKNLPGEAGEGGSDRVEHGLFDRATGAGIEEDVDGEEDAAEREHVGFAAERVGEKCIDKSGEEERLDDIATEEARKLAVEEGPDQRLARDPPGEVNQGDAEGAEEESEETGDGGAEAGRVDHAQEENPEDQEQPPL